MPTAAHLPAETEHPAADAAGIPPHHDGSARAFSPLCAGLSNDYLNHYSEALMLIEMAACDPEVAADLANWQPVDYRTYFGASDLRRAADALAAYDALPDDSRLAFEKLVAAMDALASMAVFALQPPTDPATAPVVVDATAPALRSLIARAGAFLNSGGQVLPPETEAEEAQLAIDRVLEHAAQRADSENG
jgi:hypothetical protein